MSRTFKHLTYEQRVKIKELLDGGYAKTEIARVLGIHNATIYREIERGSVNGQYDPDYSENLYKQQLPKKGPKPILAADSELSKYIAKLILEDNLSLVQIVDLMQKETRFESFPKSRTTIYHAIDKGLIPGVTRDCLKPDTTTVFSGGQIHIAKWVQDSLNIRDGDKLCFNVVDGKLIFEIDSE